jgi:hypothetical protein
MDEDEQEQYPPSPKLNPNQRREETDRAFAEIMDEDRKARLQKTMRLKSMRLVKE